MFSQVLHTTWQNVRLPGTSRSTTSTSHYPGKPSDAKIRLLLRSRSAVWRRATRVQGLSRRQDQGLRHRVCILSSLLSCCPVYPPRALQAACCLGKDSAVCLTLCVRMCFLSHHVPSTRHIGDNSSITKITITVTLPAAASYIKTNIVHIGASSCLRQTVVVNLGTKSQERQGTCTKGQVLLDRTCNLLVPALPT